MKKRIYYFLVGLLLLFILLLRVLRIAETPLGMHIDEAGLGLNAWSLAHFGTDRYGNPFPICPANFYGEQSALYTYFCALLVKLFGLNPYTLRLPAAVLGTLAVLFGALIVKEKWGERGFLVSLALFGIFPYFIMNSRFALDCNAMLGVLTMAVYCLIRLIRRAQAAPTRKLYGQFALTGVLFGIVLYTYIIAALVVAVFCLLFGLYYLLDQKEGRILRLKQLLLLAAPLGLMAIPLVLVVCVNYFSLDPIITPFFSAPRMLVNRTEEVAFSLSALPDKIRGLFHTLTSDGKYGSSEKYLTMYPWSIPLVLAGGLFSIREVVKGLREHASFPDLCMLFLVFSEALMFLLCGQYNYHINGIFCALAYFCVNGIFHLLKTLKSAKIRLALTAALFCLYGTSFLGFAADYFGADTTAALQVYGGVYDALALLSKEQREREIYILDEVGEFYFLSEPLPPAEFSAACDELGYLRDYGNLHFHSSDSYSENHVYVCNKSSGSHYALSDTSVTGCSYAVLETEHYYVFYCP